MIYEVRVYDIFVSVYGLLRAAEIVRRPSDLDTYALQKAREAVWVVGGQFSTMCRVSVDSDLMGGYYSRVSVGVFWP